MFQTITIVGVGLIGGSIGLAVRRRGLAREVRGLEQPGADIEQAVKRGAIDRGFYDPRAALRDADLVIFCTYPHLIPCLARDYAPLCSAGCIFTDVGSAKSDIVEGIEGNLPVGISFVGSHPLAGSEKSGVEHADADLFNDHLTVVTRTDKTNAAALEKTCAFWQALGSRTKVMDPADHDRALALTSHLPHLVAAALVNILPPEFAEFTATGFRDCTRIASGHPQLWMGIFLDNRNALLDALDRFEERLRFFRGALNDEFGSPVFGFLAHAKEVRDALGN